LVSYLSTWTYIGPEGIVERRFLWKTATHSYDEIWWLRIIPPTPRVHSEGPEYKVGFEGRRFTFSLANEGMTPVDSNWLTTALATRSGRQWGM
jgi:hypothetical protein